MKIIIPFFKKVLSQKLKKWRFFQFLKPKSTFCFLLKRYPCQPHKGHDEIMGFEIRKIKENFHRLPLVHHFRSLKITVLIQLTTVMTKNWRILILTKKLQKTRFFSKPPHNSWFFEKTQFWTKTQEQLRKKVVQN